MKMQSVIFVKKNLKLNTWKIKSIIRLEIIVIYTGEYRGAVHSIYNLNYSVPNKNFCCFHSRSYYDYHFIIKE